MIISAHLVCERCGHEWDGLTNTKGSEAPDENGKPTVQTLCDNCRNILQKQHKKR